MIYGNSYILDPQAQGRSGKFLNKIQSVWLVAENTRKETEKISNLSELSVLRSGWAEMALDTNACTTHDDFGLNEREYERSVKVRMRV